MIVTIDGPAGTGKSTAARALAGRLGFEILDTGAMYRAVALAALRRGLAPWEASQVSPLLPALRVEMPGGGRVMLDGEDVSGLIRTPELATASSQVAAIPAVRELLVSLQRQIGRGRDMVSEGRDQGTVVFPDAGCKFFLSADPEERARRRHADLASRGIHVDVPTLLAEQAERDERDSSREVGPLRAAADAVHIDTTHLTLAQVVEAMEREVRRRVRPAV